MKRTSVGKYLGGLLSGSVVFLLFGGIAVVITAFKGGVVLPDHIPIILIPVLLSAWFWWDKRAGRIPD